MTNMDFPALQAETSFVLSSDGRIVSVNDPPKSPPPLAWVGISGEEAVLRLGIEVPGDVEEELRAAVAGIPAGETDRIIEDISGALGRRQPVTVERGLTWQLPNGLDYPVDLEIVWWGSDQGRRLLDRLDWHMPSALVEAGFVDTGEFWPPWCVAMEGAEVSAIAFAARLGPKAADLGLYTFPGFRGRGIGAALTAAWTNHPALEGRVLFYSTSVENESSQRVAERLGLPFAGWTAEFR